MSARKFGFKRAQGSVTTGFPGAQGEDGASTPSTDATACDFVAASSQRLDVTDASLQPGENDFSMACWCLKDTSNSNQHMMGDFVSSSDSSLGLEYTSAGEIAFNMGTGSGWGRRVISDETDLQDGAWHLVVVYYKHVAQEVGISVDGGTIKQSPQTGGIDTSTTGPFTLGRTGTFAGQYHDGGIQDSAFWDRALDSSDISELWNSGSGIVYGSASAGLKTSLVSWWPLNESSGTREDVHGSNDLTAYNTPGTRDGRGA